jgi:hypothetical protein
MKENQEIFNLKFGCQMPGGGGGEPEEQDEEVEK